MSKELIIIYNFILKTLLLSTPNLLLVAVVLFFDYRHESVYASKVTKPRSTHPMLMHMRVSISSNHRLVGTCPGSPPTPSPLHDWCFCLDHS